MKTFWREEEGQDLVEYSLLLGFVALFSVALYQEIHGGISQIWSNANNALTDAAAGGTT